ncbi:16S rRNA (cytosine(967)-C(5))-methyltransferase RsmB [Desulfuromonas acetoxidans]|uniref:16S rRNA (cytosine(967)-C(5))-methyltransferase RsmB n=1 Tax=Desulfuromonas acetoxidans TaxID=891 RepID=UPI0029303B7C|nr:16S rRNA (cytosine(967)-C(5))-methyltransferase RsmB [Desulfuromonas acetoxidans]
MAKKAEPNVKDARRIAFDVLTRVDEGGYSDLVLDAALEANPGLDPRDRALATELVYGVLRRRGNLDFILKAYSRQPLKKLQPKVLRLLRLGIYQLCYLDRIPDRAVVHSMVELARRCGLERVSGLVNGVLRSYLREPNRVVWPDPRRDTQGWLEHGLSLPHWLAQRWLVQYGAEGAMALAESQLSAPPVTVRVNTLKMTRDAFVAQLKQRDIAAEPTRFAPEGVVLPHAGDLQRLPGRAEGWYQVQDEASMLIAHLLSVEPGQRLLDGCAAPGGKTTHLAALTDNRSEILALDLHSQRLEILQQGAKRLGCQQIRTLACDMTQPCEDLSAGGFDRVLIDAPCSGLGVLRRNPESRWRRKQTDIKVLAKTQRQILHQAAELVVPGGLLLYSLCTTTPEESTAVVADFLAHHPMYVQVNLANRVPKHWEGLFDDDGQLVTRTGEHGPMDCFFAAGFYRQPECSF